VAREVGGQEWSHALLLDGTEIFESSNLPDTHWASAAASEGRSHVQLRCIVVEGQFLSGANQSDGHDLLAADNRVGTAAMIHEPPPKMFNHFLQADPLREVYVDALFNLDGKARRTACPLALNSDQDFAFFESFYRKDAVLSTQSSYAHLVFQAGANFIIAL